MTRPYLPELIASDASPSFGFGTSVAPCSEDVARRIGALAERQGAHVRLACENDVAEKPRLGEPHRLKLSKDGFTDVLCIKAAQIVHSGLLEAEALLLSIRWGLRSLKRYGRRWSVLVDAQTVVGAVTKGRSASKPSNHITRKIASNQLAGDVLLRITYIPSESNSADLPSRGKRRRPRERREALKVKKLDKMKQERQRLRDSVNASPYAAELRGLMAHELGSVCSSSPASSEQPCNLSEFIVSCFNK